MGLNHKSLRYVMTMLDVCRIRLRTGTRVLEFGNTRIRADAAKYTKRLVGTRVRTMKELLEHYNVEDISIDLNGRDGSLPLDLSKPIASDIGTFHAVLNAGTLEHIDNHRQAFDTATELCKPGGIAIHIAPLSGASTHGLHQYTPPFFSAMTGWQVVDLALSTGGFHRKTLTYIYCTLRRLAI